MNTVQTKGFTKKACAGYKACVLLMDKMGRRIFVLPTIYRKRADAQTIATQKECEIWTEENQIYPA